MDQEMGNSDADVTEEAMEKSNGYKIEINYSKKYLLSIQTGKRGSAVAHKLRCRFDCG